MWEILGIDPTKDLSKIKAAYSKLLKKHHPEEDPEGYQRLREAFDSACKYAKGKKTPVQHRQQEDVNKDEDISSFNNYRNDYDDIYDIDDFKNNADTNVDVILDQSVPNDSDFVTSFLHNLEKLYSDYEKRIKLECWETLFSEYVVINSKERDLLNTEVFKFVDTHRLFPYEIWKYLNDLMEWNSIDCCIYEEFDEDFINQVIGQLNNKYSMDKYEIDNINEDFDCDRFISLRISGAEDLRLHNHNDALQNLEEAYKLNKHDKILCRLLCQLYKRTNMIEKGLEFAEIYIAMDTETVRGYKFRAHFNYKLGKYKDAIKDCDRVLSNDNDVEIIMLKCKSLMELNKYKEAKAVLELVFEIDKYDIQAILMKNVINTRYEEFLLEQTSKSAKAELKKLQKELKKYSPWRQFFRDILEVIRDLLCLIKDVFKLLLILTPIIVIILVVLFGFKGCISALIN